MLVLLPIRRVRKPSVSTYNAMERLKSGNADLDRQDNEAAIYSDQTNNTRAGFTMREEAQGAPAIEFS